jgi:DNA-binding SARP family transcriptional activator
MEVDIDGDRLVPNRRRERSLLAILLLHSRQVVSTARLQDLLWDGSPPARAERIIHSHIARLRAVFRDPRSGQDRLELVRCGPGYVIRLDPLSVDAHVFVESTKRAMALTRPDDRAAALRSALALWRGPALVDAATERLRDRLCRHLEELRLSAVESWIEAELAIGRAIEVVAEAGRYAAEHPLRERLTMLHALALYRAGRRVDALAVLGEARTRLANDLGLDPSAEISQLYQAILRDDDSLGPVVPTTRLITTAPVSAPLAPDPPPGNVLVALPEQVTPFVDRPSELRKLDAWEQTNGGSPAVLITGAPGVGKTALATEWARRNASRFPDGQFYLHLGGFQDEPPMEQAVALELLLLALGVPPEQVPTEVGARAALYWRTLAARRVLVILDDARTADQVRPLVARMRTSRAIVTSRCRLDGLLTDTISRHLPLDRLEVTEAVQMLYAAGVLPTADDPRGPRLAELCDRLPLALRIVTCRLSADPTCNLDTLLDDLADEGRRLDVLDLDGDSSGIRHALRRSVESLSTVALWLLVVLSDHPSASFTVHEIAQRTGETAPLVRQALAELIRNSLATPIGQDRYTLPALVRLYAREQAGSIEAALPADCSCPPAGYDPLTSTRIT